MRELFICVRVADEAVPMGIGAECPNCGVGRVSHIDTSNPLDPNFSCTRCSTQPLPELSVEVRAEVHYRVNANVAYAERKKGQDPEGSQPSDELPF